MRFGNLFSSPVLFAAIMMGTLVGTSAKQHRADHHHAHRRAHHHHNVAKTPSTEGTMTEASGLGDTPLWVCPNNGVCSNHSSVSEAAKNIGVCQDSHGNPVTPTRYCWIPTPGHPTPTVQDPFCDCSWPSGTSGCVVSSPAPAFYACTCSLGHKVGSCVGIASPCTDATNYQVSNCYATKLLETRNG